MRNFTHIFLFGLKKVLKSIFRVDVSWARGGDPCAAMSSIFYGYEVKCIVDGGAYVGSFSKAMMKYFPGSTYLLFEPTPNSFELCMQNFSKYKNVVLSKMALSNGFGVANFFVNKSQLTNSLKTSNDNSSKYHGDLCEAREVISVSTCSLDDYIAEKNLPLPDIIKLDLQGSEIEALAGAKKCLSYASAVLCEVQFVQLYEGASSFTDVHNLLSNLGFTLFQFYDISRDLTSGRILFADALYLRPTLFEPNVGVQY